MDYDIANQDIERAVQRYEGNLKAAQERFISLEEANYSPDEAASIITDELKAAYKAKLRRLGEEEDARALLTGPNADG